MRNMPESRAGRIARENRGLISETPKVEASKTAQYAIYGAIFAVILTVVLVLSLALSGTLTTDPAVTPVVPTNTSLGLPLIKPPVEAAAPTGLGGLSAAVFLHAQAAKSHFKTESIDPTEIESRFFNEDGGPTNLYGILEAVDGRIRGINQRKEVFAECMNATLTTPVAYNISASWATLPLFYASCSENFTGELITVPSFDQFALVQDLETNTSAFYIYERGGDAIVAAKVDMDAEGTVTLEQVWFSVGVQNRNGSHGSHAVLHIKARPAIKEFEMVVAGSGVGFCGAQLRSINGTVLNITGSVDMGATCVASDSSCCNGATLALVLATNCTGSASDFTLAPLGRQNYTGQGASQYPGGVNNVVVLTVNTTDAVYFGPEAPVV
jgi:hypothetical protein